MNSVRGTVASGIGWHAKNMGQWGSLPFAAYPGTLNVEVGVDAARKVEALTAHAVRFEGTEWRFVLGTLDGIQVAVHVSGHVKSQVEVLASVRLRDLPLADGDAVTILLTPDL